VINTDNPKSVKFKQSNCGIDCRKFAWHFNSLFLLSLCLILSLEASITWVSHIMHCANCSLCINSFDVNTDMTEVIFEVSFPIFQQIKHIKRNWGAWVRSSIIYGIWTEMHVRQTQPFLLTTAVMLFVGHQLSTRHWGRW
jgi:hypothetical protein